MARPATTLPHPLVAGATCVDLSVLVPVYNEQETLPELERRLEGVLDGLGLDCEVIAVNDGSADGTLALLRAWSGRDPRVRVIDFSRNFGHQAALYAALCRARGRAVVLMDGSADGTLALLRAWSGRDP